MRKKIVAGNWKMNTSKEEAIQLTNELKDIQSDAEVILFVPFIHLQSVGEILQTSQVRFGAQNMYYKDSGAFTGEISPTQLKSYQVPWVLIGHSERRIIFGESPELLKKKVNAALEHQLQIMFCFGEELEARKAGVQEEIVKQQLEESVFQLKEDQIKNVVFAYEPVWAIGTGLAASPQQAQDMHAYIRSLIANRYNDEVATNFTILYGGSVKPNNAKDLFEMPDIDGGLIGGASLQAADFTSIVESI